jgi:hypothetical protein
VLYVVSDTRDRIHNGNVDAVIEEISILHKKVIEVLPELPEVFFAAPAYAEYVSPYTTSAKFKGVTIVGDDEKRTLQIPNDWFPLLKNEQILAVEGQCFRMNCWMWFRSIMSCGYFYCCHVRKHKYERSAIILTNKRVVEMDIFQRAGTIPSSLANFSVRVRSFLPGSVKAGYISCREGQGFSCLPNWCYVPGFLEAGKQTKHNAIPSRARLLLLLMMLSVVAAMFALINELTARLPTLRLSCQNAAYAPLIDTYRVAD